MGARHFFPTAGHEAFLMGTVGSDADGHLQGTWKVQHMLQLFPLNHATCFLFCRF